MNILELPREVSNLEEETKQEQVAEQKEDKQENQSPSEGNNVWILVAAVAIALVLLYFLLPALVPGTEGPSTLLRW